MRLKHKLEKEWKSRGTLHEELEPLERVSLQVCVWFWACISHENACCCAFMSLVLSFGCKDVNTSGANKEATREGTATA